MPREFSRNRRVGEQIQRELAQIIPHHITLDKSLLVTVSAVEISPDFQQAKVYVTVLGETMNHADVVKWLNQHASAVRYALAHSLNLRSTPTVRFVYDQSVENGAYLNQLINQAVQLENH
jgi:ribosome-binding factor A